MENNVSNLYLKTSRFSFVYRKNGHVALYHSLLTNIVYGKDQLLALLEEFSLPTTIAQVMTRYPETAKEELAQAIDILFENGFLIDVNFDEDSLIGKICDIIPREPTITALVLLPTDRCNFGCRYCHTMNNMPSGYKSSLMGEDLAKKGIELFAKCSAKHTSELKNIIFSGGEPFINFSTIKAAVDHTRKLQASDRFKGGVKFTAFTNCSLVTRDIANFISENDISVVASIDGPRDIHDQMRLFANQEPTFDQVIQGYTYLKEAGCKVGICCTIGSHNVHLLPDIVRYFVNELHPINLGLNTLHAILGKKNPAHVSVEEAAASLIEAHKIARKAGLYIVHAINRIRVIAEKKPRLKDCPAAGKQILITPDGQIGQCEAFTGTRDFFIDFDQSDCADILTSRAFQQWNKRCAFTMTSCFQCAAISLCGGGCAYDAYNESGKLLSADTRICTQCKMFLEWMIWDVFEKVEPGHKKHQLFQVLTPSDSELHALYGNVPIDTMTRPLEEYHSKIHTPGATYKSCK